MIEQAGAGSSGAILVVDDEPTVRKLVSTVLISAGYEAILADGAAQALKTFAKRAAEITLLLTDVVAPGMSGPALATELLESHPHLKVVYMTGFTESTVVRRFVVERGFPLLLKPFTSDQLLAVIKEAIGPPVSRVSS